MSVRAAQRALRNAVRETGRAAIQVLCAYVGVLWTAARVYGEPEPEPEWGVWCTKTRGGKYPPDSWLTAQLGYGPVLRMTESQARAKATLLNRAGAMMGHWRYEARVLSDQVDPAV